MRRQPLLSRLPGSGSCLLAVAFVAALRGIGSQAAAQGPALQSAGKALAAPADPAAYGAAGPGAGANAGGSANADFDSLIDLITSTVEADSWMENGTGEGDVQPFPNGVYVDADGALCVANPLQPRVGGLSNVRKQGLEGKPTSAASANRKVAPQGDARRPSALRFVSLPRLERAIEALQQAHQPLPSEMLALAGLRRIAYIVVDKTAGDLILAGPAGDWATAPGGRIVAADTGRPVVRLDDLLELLRHDRTNGAKPFGCSIVPRQQSLAAAQEYLAATASQPIEASQRRDWLEGLRATVGVQDVEYYGIDPNTRIARLLLEADYHMKLVGMGLAKGTPGVRSYLATVRPAADGMLPPMTVLRWWFSLAESTVETTAERDVFALPEQCVQVLSENELLAARGQRVHTGQSEELNQQFAESFTQHFAALCDRYPVYGELARIFEASLAMGVVRREGLCELAGWTPTLLVDAGRLRLPQSPAPRRVETVINHRVIGGRQIVAGVSGGVWIDGRESTQLADTLDASRKPASPGHGNRRADDGEDETRTGASRLTHWWWD
jgi:hypothetical protein